MKETTFNKKYFIHSDGKLTSTMRGLKVLKPIKNNFGYLQYYLKDEQTNVYKWYKVHRLVALHYIDNPKGLNEVNHIDGNKENNNISNLEWVTHSENVKHSYINRVIKKGIESKLYGRKATEQTKAKQSEQKKGIKHPKFKGYYCYNGVKYESSFEASKHTNIHQRSIIRYSKANSNGWTFEPI